MISISMRNKKILSKIKEGERIDDIAKDLGLKVETVLKEIAYLKKEGFIK